MALITERTRDLRRGAGVEVTFDTALMELVSMRIVATVRPVRVRFFDTDGTVLRQVSIDPPADTTRDLSAFHLPVGVATVTTPDGGTKRTPIYPFQVGF